MKIRYFLRVLGTHSLAIQATLPSAFQFFFDLNQSLTCFLITGASIIIFILSVSKDPEGFGKK